MPQTLTINNIPDDLARRIKQKAAEDGTSVEQTVISMLEEAFGLRRSDDPDRDLARFIGTWTKEEAEEFEESLREQRRIDWEMWD